jgi:hypothetical protein
VSTLFGAKKFLYQKKNSPGFYSISRRFRDISIIPEEGGTPCHPKEITLIAELRSAVGS